MMEVFFVIGRAVQIFSIFHQQLENKNVYEYFTIQSAAPQEETPPIQIRILKKSR